MSGRLPFAVVGSNAVVIFFLCHHKDRTISSLDLQVLGASGRLLLGSLPSLYTFYFLLTQK